jgi:tetratricopeptide (TPR) repeat protein
MARTLINLGVEAYFESRWSDAAAHYLEALDAAERAGSVVLAANAAINSAEVLCDQGYWKRALELFDGASRNYNAVGYTPGAAATSLFSSVAAMRDGNLAGARQRLTHARHEIERLEMEFVSDLRSRELELEVLEGTATLEGCVDALKSSSGDPMLTARAARCRAVVHLQAGDIRLALDGLEQLLADFPAPDFERANALRLTARIAPQDTRTPAWREESSAIYLRLGVAHAPPLTAGDIADQATEVASVHT